MKEPMETKFKLGPNQERWLRALESGKYRRGRDHLKVKTRSGFKYCCLGVACKLTGVKWEHDKDRDLYLVDGSDEVPSGDVIEWLGLLDEYGSPSITCPPRLPLMTEMNDDLNLSFKKIAAKIRKDPEKYFVESR